MITPTLLQRLLQGKSLTREEAREVMDKMMQGANTAAQIASFLTALRFKGETVDELTGFAQSMRDHAVKLSSVPTGAIDTCGTGGDGGKTFNISTASAFVVASSGVPVAKHGNRAVSSQSGSADVLEALGVQIQQTPSEAESLLHSHQLCFLFAPVFHEAMRHVMPTRHELGFRTFFNLLGPLTNPANVKRQLIGVYDWNLTETIAKVCKELGLERVLVVSGYDGLDEITITGSTRVSELRYGEIQTYDIEPEQFGISCSSLSEIAGGEAVENARLIQDIFNGLGKDAARDVIALNAGASLYLADRAGTLSAGIQLALQMIEDGTTAQFLENYIRQSKEGKKYVSSEDLGIKTT